MESEPPETEIGPPAPYEEEPPEREDPLHRQPPGPVPGHEREPESEPLDE
jgi:hypothetical protein